MFQHPEQISHLHAQSSQRLLKMSSAEDAETSVTGSNSPSQHSLHSDDQIPLKYVTPGFKPFSNQLQNNLSLP